jgi:hypothetical protein
VTATREATREAARAVSEAAKPAAESIWKWLLPVLAVAAMAVLLLWYFFGRTPQVKAPDFAQVNTDLTGTFKSLTDSLNGIKDATSAETALPKLKELDGKLDAMKALVGKLPDADKHKVTDLIKANVGKLEDQFAKLMWIPGVGDKIRSPVDGIMGKLTALGGLPASKVSQVSADMNQTVSSLSGLLPSIKDSESAEAALPKLRDIGDKLDGAKSALDGLSEDSRSTILGQLKLVLGKLKEIAEKVLAMPGVGDKVKPAIAAIMSKLNALVA